MTFSKAQVDSLCQRSGTDEWKKIGKPNHCGLLFSEEDPRFIKLMANMGVNLQPAKNKKAKAPKANDKPQGGCGCGRAKKNK